MALLDIIKVKKMYPVPGAADACVLDIPRFTVGAGEQVALFGTSGCGKTTFLNIIAGILSPTNGRITLDGTDLTALSEAERDRFRAEHIGYVFQAFNLLQGFSALENVTIAMSFGRGADADVATALLERVGLQERLHYKPRQLSIGQLQRVAVARAMAVRPSLVLADEPTGNLDPHHAGTALTLMRELCRESGAALVLVSHDHDILDQFDRVEDLTQLNRAVADIGAKTAEAGP